MLLLPQGLPTVHLAVCACALALHVAPPPAVPARAPAAPSTTSPGVVSRPPGPARAGGWLPAGDSAVGFRLSDQFGRVHDAAAYRGRPLLLVGAGRGGRAAATAWVEALRGLQGDPAGAAPALSVVAVADLRGVPRLLRRVVRGRFPDDRGQAVLLDWDGTLARRYQFAGDSCTILLVGPAGRAHAQTTRTAVAGVVDTARARALLREAAALTPPAPTAAFRAPAAGVPAAGAGPTR
jgi:hypothetical protein